MLWRGDKNVRLFAKTQEVTIQCYGGKPPSGEEEDGGAGREETILALEPARSNEDLSITISEFFLFQAIGSKMAKTT